MIEFSGLKAAKLLKNFNYLGPRDDDDRKLDNIQTSYVFDKSINADIHLKPTTNTLDDDEFYTVVDKDDISFGTTNRGGRELYMCGYTYQIKRQEEETTRWRCIVRTPPCPVTIHTYNVDDSFYRWNGVSHHHHPDRNRELIRNLIAKIKARVLIEPHPVLFIAEEEICTANLDKTRLAAMPLPSYMGMLFIKKK